MENLNVVHTFHHYLPNTSNWAYKLINNLPDTKNIIVAEKFLKMNFYNPDFMYIEFPLREIDVENRTLKIRVFNRLVIETRNRLYFSYIKSLLKNEQVKVHIVHSHFGTAGWNFRKLVKKLNTIHVVSFYGQDYEMIPFLQPVWKKRYKELFDLANLFVCEGNHGAKILKNMGCPEEKIVVNRLGVEVENIPFFKREKKKGELKLVQISAFRQKKGHIFTVKAFENALKNCPNMSLTLVGEGPEKEKIKNYVYKNNLQDRVRVLKGIRHEEVYNFLKDYHVFIHPSCYTENKDCEGGAPVALLDAQATGMPVISTTHCDIPEEVVHEKTGFLSPEKDIKTLTKYIETFYNMEQETYDKFSHFARKHVEKFYNIKENAKKLKDIYLSLIRG